LECHQKGSRAQKRPGTELDTYLLVFANDIHLLDVNINIKRNTEALLDASKQFGLEVNAAITKYMSISCHKTTI
jgi:hypothetical protein